MRNDVKKYYQSQFSSFPKISAKEISELNNYELQLLELPRLFYLKSTPTTPELLDKFQKFFSTIKN